MKLSRLISGLAIILALASCASVASRSEGAAYAEPGYEADSGADRMMQDEAAPAPSSGSPAAPSAERSMASGGLIAQNPGADQAPVTVPDDVDQESPAATRLRVYSAELSLVVASIEESRDAIISLVEDGGGYVESSAADYLVVRVPASDFESILGSIEAEGDVRSRAVRTSDVTDQFFDIERRLKISEASRQRLLELLEATEDADERVNLLRDIRRLTEEIEQLRSSLQSLEQLIQFSRITVQLVSRIQMSQIQRQQIPFPWIAGLAPLGSSTFPATDQIPFEPDESFAVFESGTRIFAEAADGTQIRVGAVPNEPSGDTRFWKVALAYHLTEFYRSATDLVSGNYQGLIFESRDRDPFFYLVMVAVRDTEILVLEVFFPNSDARDDRLDAVLAAAAGGDQ